MGDHPSRYCLLRVAEYL